MLTRSDIQSELLHCSGDLQRLNARVQRFYGDLCDHDAHLANRIEEVKLAIGKLNDYISVNMEARGDDRSSPSNPRMPIQDEWATKTPDERVGRAAGRGEHGEPGHRCSGFCPHYEKKS